VSCSFFLFHVFVFNQGCSFLMIFLLCVAFCFGLGAAVSDLMILVYGPISFVLVGQAATYDVIVNNLGPSIASGVVVTISVDPSASFISSSIWSVLFIGRFSSSLSDWNC
jgi:uncharacterized repeat protein (TIGR01451 family)